MKLSLCYLDIKMHKTLIKLDQAAVFKTYYVMMALLLIKPPKEIRLRQ